MINEFSALIHKKVYRKQVKGKDFTGVCVGESFTGGRIASALTLYPGASDYFLGGVVFYHPSVKKGIGVSSDVVDTEIVSEKCALESAKRVLELFRSYGLDPQVAVSSTGNDEEYFVALVTNDRFSRCIRSSCEGGRAEIQDSGVTDALSLILEYLEN